MREVRVFLDVLSLLDVLLLLYPLENVAKTRGDLILKTAGILAKVAARKVAKAWRVAVFCRVLFFVCVFFLDLLEKVAPLHKAGYDGDEIDVCAVHAAAIILDTGSCNG